MKASPTPWRSVGNILLCYMYPDMQPPSHGHRPVSEAGEETRLPDFTPFIFSASVSQGLVEDRVATG